MQSRAHPIVEAFASLAPTAQLGRALPRAGERMSVGGSVGSTGSALLAALHRAHGNRIFVGVVPDPISAVKVQNDLETLLGSDASHIYPQSETRFYSEEESDAGLEGLRVEAIEALLGGGARLFVATPRALQERMPIPDRLARLRLELTEGEQVGFGLLVEELDRLGYERVPLVEEVGQFAVRGGLVDVFSLGLSDPVRIEFWGDEIASIRQFEVGDQRSTASLPRVHLIPATFRTGGKNEGGTARSLLEVLPSDAMLVGLGSSAWEEDFQRHWTQARSIRSDREESGERLPAPEVILLPPAAAAEIVRAHPTLRVTGEPGHDLSLDAEPPPVIERKMDRLLVFLREEAAREHRTLILCDNDGQVERLEEILEKGGGRLPGVQIGVGTVDAGFRIPSSPPLTVLTDHEIFRRRRRVRSGRRYRGAMALESLAQLAPGDYVVHMDHGIGRFRSLERIEVGGESIEVLAIEYADGETLRVPVYRLDLVERWVGESEDSEPPAVHRIGGKRWKALRRKTEAAIEQATRELLELYAERELVPGHAFPPDTKWQAEMEAAFLYEDTPDQRQATKDVKRDMESPRPMDRLICGDVGFGKTEVGIRAAFKAIQDGKQVAVLAPTTILVEQHLRTFSERLADFPVKIESLSRFRTPREQKALLASVAGGNVDLVIGTHRLLSEDVRFRDLGLLIVDEEQRFGVKHKEKLKRFRASVDVLTLTATPIPRTLQLSLAGIRNLSLIRTPPRDRLAITTQAIPWTDDGIEDLVARELDRGGQVFFLHNRVETIRGVAERVAALAPEARVGVAHGQMRAAELEKVMGKFVRGEVDVLVCSSIIENGLDVSNANTLIVDRADQFGLAQLYQIRGRVGRSDRRAYCYLIVPDAISEEARERIRVLERHTELGSGYQVALRDLEIRGAGNLLGASQSGFAYAVGLDTYLRMLEDTVRRLKQGSAGGDRYPEPDVSLPGSAFLPDQYVSDSGQKLHLYRRLSKVEDRSEVEQLREEITDRYGPPPEEVEHLLDSHVLRLLGRRLGIERIFVKDREARITFRASATPRMTALEAPFRDRQLRVEIRRMVPLSLSLEQAGPEPVTRTLIRALDAVAAVQTKKDAA